MKMLPVIIILFILSACASTKPTVVDQTGRQFPTPNYTLQDIKGEGISVMFYFSKFDEIKDLDGAIQSRPITLNMLKHNEVPVNSKVVLNIELSNPKKAQYAFWERVQTFKAGGNSSIPDAKGGRIAVSNLEYRQFSYTLPTSSDLQIVNYGIDIIGANGAILLHIGDFNYSISGSGGNANSKKEEPIINNVGKGGLSEADRKAMKNN